MIVIFLLLPLILYNIKAKDIVTITPQQAQEIGLKIWHNECGKSIEGLTSWNAGEEFPSLGIGHFIWYPSNKNHTFKQTFPALLWFMKIQNTSMPEWLKKARFAPWKTREQFYKAFDSTRMKELRKFLASTIDLQTQFIIKRFKLVLPTLVKNLSIEQKRHVTKQFYRVARTPQGIYALVDYLNFKGEGVQKNNNYKGARWGLLQVLQGMRGTHEGKVALKEFAQSAEKVLLNRIKNAPRDESRWWPGWKNRISTYYS